MERRLLFGWVAKVLIFALTSLALLELLFRFVVPASMVPSSVQLEQGGIMLFDTSVARSGYHTVGRIPTDRYQWIINDQGWNSEFTYLTREERDRPLIALIGDSHVENLMSNVDESIASHLYNILDGSCLVYSFGKGDQSLIQNLMVMDYIDSLYHPDTFIMVVGGDVILRSLLPEQPIYNYLVPQDSGFIIEGPVPRMHSHLARTVLSSALVRYFRFNVRLDLFPLYHFQSEPFMVNEGLDPDRVAEMLPDAAGFILDTMSARYGDRGVLIFLNFFISRYNIYGGEKSRTVRNLSEPVDFNTLLELCRNYPDINCVDLKDAFAEDWEANGITFESSDDKHLNGYGNLVVAEAILSYLESSGTLSRLLEGEN